MNGLNVRSFVFFCTGSYVFVHVAIFFSLYYFIVMLAYAFIDNFVYGITCDWKSYNILYMNLGSGIILSYWSGQVGAGQIRSGIVLSSHITI